MPCATGIIQVTTAAPGNTISISGLGFQPGAVFFRWTGRDSQVDAGPSCHNNRAGFGFMLANGKRGCIAEGVQNGADPYRVSSGIFNDECIVALDPDDYYGSLGEADFSSIEADGFTIVIDEQFGSALTATYLAVDNYREFQMIEFTEPAATGNAAYAGAGFQPAFVMILGTKWSAYDVSYGNNTDSSLMIGTASGPSADLNAVWCKHEESYLGYADTAHYCRRTECIGMLSSSGSPVARASLVSFDADGFTLSWLERDTTGRKYIGVVATGNWFVGQSATRADTTEWGVSGFTWTPEGLAVISAAEVENAQDTVAIEAECSVGFGTGIAARNCLYTGYTYDGDTGESDCTSWHDFDEIYLNASKGAAPVSEGQMDISTAFAANSIKFVMDDADPAAKYFFYIAVGPPVLEFRESLVKYLHNTYQSRKAGRILIIDKLGRTIKPEQLEVDNWIFSGAAGFPTPTKYENLMEDPNVFYAESNTVSEGAMQIATDREGFFESIMRTLGRG